MPLNMHVIQGREPARTASVTSSVGNSDADEDEVMREQRQDLNVGAAARRGCC